MPLFSRQCPSLNTFYDVKGPGSVLFSFFSLIRCSSFYSIYFSFYSSCLQMKGERLQIVLQSVDEDKRWDGLGSKRRTAVQLYSWNARHVGDLLQLWLNMHLLEHRSARSEPQGRGGEWSLSGHLNKLSTWSKGTPMSGKPWFLADVGLVTLISQSGRQ